MTFPSSSSVTMKDIAHACGVSVVSVSRALRDDPNHALATRRRIQQMAAKMGYRPNPLVSALMSERGRHKPGKSTVNLGLLQLAGGWESHGFYRGAVGQAQSLGYSIECFPLDPGLEAAKKLRRILEYRGVRGLVVLPAPTADWRMDFDFGGMAAATIGYSIVSPVLPRVVTDSFGRLGEVLELAARCGYRRVGLLSTFDDNERLKNQYLASVMVHHHVAKPRVQVFRLDLESDRWSEKNRRLLVDWIRARRLEAVITQLAGTDRALAKSGIRIPEDLAFVHLHRHEDAAVACMDQMQETMGKKAADLVVGMINRNEFELPERPQTVIIPSVWRPGASFPSRSR